MKEKEKTIRTRKEGVMLGIRLQVKGDSKGNGTIHVKQSNRVHRSFYHSAVIARKVAEKVAGKRFDSDILIEKTKNEIIAGGSGGLFLTLLFLSMLTGRKLKSGITGTGGICGCGIVLAVRNTAAKAEAARRAGYRVFLYPHGQSPRPIGGITYIPVRNVIEAMKIVGL